MLNIAIVMGRLTADPELKFTPNNIAVTSFTLAVNRSYAKSQEDRQTDFIDIVAWRNTAEFVSKYFKKGSMIIIQGEIQTRTYEDKNGNKHKVCEVVASNVNFAESKKSAETKEEPEKAASESLKETVRQPAAPDSFEDTNFDDDLPF